MQWLESSPGQENMLILPKFYGLWTSYLLSSIAVTKYYYYTALNLAPTYLTSLISRISLHSIPLHKVAKLYDSYF